MSVGLLHARWRRSSAPSVRSQAIRLRQRLEWHCDARRSSWRYWLSITETQSECYLGLSELQTKLPVYTLCPSLPCSLHGLQATEWPQHTEAKVHWYFPHISMHQIVVRQCAFVGNRLNRFNDFKEKLIFIRSNCRLSAAPTEYYPVSTTQCHWISRCFSTSLNGFMEASD